MQIKYINLKTEDDITDTLSTIIYCDCGSFNRTSYVMMILEVKPRSLSSSLMPSVDFMMWTWGILDMMNINQLGTVWLAVNRSDLQAMFDAVDADADLLVAHGEAGPCLHDHVPRGVHREHGARELQLRHPGLVLHPHHRLPPH